MSDVAAIVVAAAALIGSGTAIGTLIVTRKGNREEHDTDKRTSDFEILRGTIAELRTDLGSARTEAGELQEALDHARDDVQKLQRELNAALANVAILSDHIREHVPDEVAFPRLRRVWPA